jgi:hypothetical protein
MLAAVAIHVTHGRERPARRLLRSAAAHLRAAPDQAAALGLPYGLAEAVEAAAHAAGVLRPCPVELPPWEANQDP